VLELYHHGSSVCAAKVRFALAEKGLEWQGHYIDILKGDQFDPAYIKLNAKAVVPTLVHDGHPIVESTVICEYVDDVFPSPPLKPADPLQRAEMRLWTKAVDELLHPMCGEITFACSHRHTVARLGPEGLAKFLASTPPVSVTAGWHDRKKVIVKEGLGAPGIEKSLRHYDRFLQKMEDALGKRPWIAGNSFSLADIGLTPYVNRLDMMSMSEMWIKSRPRLTDWFERIKARPSFRPSLIEWCPPDLTKDLATFGAQSWPANYVGRNGRADLDQVFHEQNTSLITDTAHKQDTAWPMSSGLSLWRKRHPFTVNSIWFAQAQQSSRCLRLVALAPLNSGSFK
jgi:glutathione S-transferase